MAQRRSALGRGLGALISNSNSNSNADQASRVDPEVRHTQGRVDTVTRQAGRVASAPGPREIPIERIDPNPEQPRREFDAQALEQLARSITEHGVLQPIVVREAGDRYELVMGERRFRASQLAGRTTIPAVVADIEPDDRLELAIVENVQREDLNPIELAHAYRALAESGYTQEEIGRKVSMDRSSIANHIRLLELSRTIQGDLESGRITMGHAKALLQVGDPDGREALRERILKHALSVRLTEQAARELASTTGGTASGSARRPATAPIDPDTRAFVERIERKLQTKVTLHAGPRGAGRLEIKYFDLGDLERIGGLLLGDAG